MSRRRYREELEGLCTTDYFDWCEFELFVEPYFDIRNYLERCCGSIELQQDCKDLLAKSNEFNAKIKAKQRVLRILSELKLVWDCIKATENTVSIGIVCFFFYEIQHKS